MGSFDKKACFSRNSIKTREDRDKKISQEGWQRLPGHSVDETGRDE
jgi:hypothetical protein